MLTDLTALEQRVVEAAHRGTWAEGGGGLSVEELAITEDQGLWVRAELIRELLLGRHEQLDPHGVRVREVRVVGLLDLDHVTTTTPLHLNTCAISERITCCDARLRELNLFWSMLPGLHADCVRVDGNLFLRGVTVRGSGNDGAVRLLGAHIGSQANLSKAEIVNDSGPGLHADNLRVDGDLFLRGVTVRGSGSGAVRMHSAYIGGQADLDKAEIFNDSGPGMIADNLRVDGGLFLSNVTVRGSSNDGAVRLPIAHISGQASLDKAEIVNDSGPGLDADNLRVDGDLSLRGVTVRGSGDDGAVRLPGAHICSQASLDKAEIVNDSGPGLHADGLRVDGDLSLRGVTVRGSGDDGAVNLHSAHIGGQLSVKDAQVVNTSGPLLVLAEAHVAKVLVFPVSVVCAHGGVGVGRRSCAVITRQISVQRLEFARLQGMSWRQWLHLLVHHTPDYAPQPFQQLAAVERAAGHDSNAREILITQQNELLRRTPEALGDWWGQQRHRLWGWLGRYGYRAHRLVTALAVILALAGGTAYLAGQIPTRPGHHAAERVRPTTAPPDTGGTACSTVELVGLGLDRGLPLGATGLRARCDLDTGTKRGQAFTVLLWLLQSALWALATLTVAAYTGMIRKPA